MGLNAPGSWAMGPQDVHEAPLFSRISLFPQASTRAQNKGAGHAPIDVEVPGARRELRSTHPHSRPRTLRETYPDDGAERPPKSPANRCVVRGGPCALVREPHPRPCIPHVG
ncbi:hypothetical protein C8T65DRAFT_103488 [Cerioporus squamosus]|nr:hypothetical protein C8T65DRAFT_103488 [Cerioporus squamosus]